MEKQIFRQKSVERIALPEQLQDYMRVTTPGVWMVLAAVILLLAGLILSSALVNVESKITEQAVVAEDGLMLDIALPLSQKSVQMFTEKAAAYFDKDVKEGTYNPVLRAQFINLVKESLETLTD